ncbi:MAG TPA: hemolysin family protein [Spirochaetia bacterium]|nr:hemolysin family protein [Spirochaetia bacterium]
MTLSYLSLAVLVLLSSFFSATETAFTSLSVVQIQDMKKKYGVRGELIERLTQRSDRLLTTILIGNNLVNIAASALASAITIEHFGNEYLGIMTGILTLVILVFGEVTPKQLAIANNEFVTLHTARTISVLTYALLPISWALGGISRIVMRLTGGRKNPRITLESFLHLISHAENIGVLESYRTRILRNVFRFSAVTVQAVMTHRTNVFSLEQDRMVQESLPEITRRGFSRIPIYDEDPEKIVGVVLVKDIMRAMNDGKLDVALKKIMVPPIFVPESRRINRMLAQFKREKLNMAVVLDEYGGLSGVVTVEDVIEEILGDLYDEHEVRESEKVTRAEDGSFIVRGNTPIYVLNDLLHLELPYSRNVQTIGGYLTDLAGRIPSQFEVIDTPAGKFVVEAISRKQILSIRYLNPEPAAERTSR